MNDVRVSRFRDVTDGLDRAKDLASLATTIRAEIEAFTVRPAYLGTTAYTARHTFYTVICNGAIKIEGDAPAPLATPMEMASASIAVAKQLREKIDGDAYAVWRHIPQFGEDGTLYMRLCFESLPVDAN